MTIWLIPIAVLFAWQFRQVPGSVEQVQKWGQWLDWGDQGDGTYRNPVIPADYSDLDCIRVGSDYYAISSTMQFSPGMVIITSKDLVNWTIVGHVVADLTQIGPEMNWDRMNCYGRGIWAGSLRFHDNKFWVYFGTPDEGYFLSTASTAAGPWSPLDHVLKGAGWDDVCPFWDDDGQGYLVGTSFRDAYKIYVWKLTPDGSGIVEDSGRVIHQSRGSEANKLFKFKGRYYHLFSEVHADGRAVMMERANEVYGPYTEVKQLNYPERDVNEPNQGGLVQSAAGDWFWFTHHGKGDWEGRCASLLPVTWIDGWPILGEPDGKGIGRFVWSGKKPLKSAGNLAMRVSDEFTESRLMPQWEWNYQPRSDKWSLTERRGWLRLHAFRPIERDNLLKAGNTLTQRSFRTAASEVVIRLDLRGMANGETAGLSHFAKDFSVIGVRQSGGARRLEFQQGPHRSPGVEWKRNEVWFKSTWGLDGLSQSFYSADGNDFIPFGEPYQLSWGYYRGDRIGIYNYNDLTDTGYVDVDYFRYKMLKR